VTRAGSFADERAVELLAPEEHHPAKDERVTVKAAFDVRVPFVARDAREIPTLALDHRAGFVLSQIDGVSTIEMLIDVCGMDRLELLRILGGLVEQGVVLVR
jgi:hypothetical protein